MKTREIVKILKGMIAVWIAWCCLSCHHDYLRYDTHLKDVLYLTGIDSNYVYLNQRDPVDTGVFRIVVKLMGMPKDYKRSYKIEVVDSSTTAVEDVHYKFPSDLIFPADTVQDYLYITLYRDRDPELKKRNVELAFKLVNSDDFEIIPVNDYNISVCHLFIGYAAIQELEWWSFENLGQLYNEKVASKLVELYYQLEQTNPAIYEILKDGSSGNFEKWGYFVFENNLILAKRYLLFPLYNYFLEHPEPGVEIPKPQY